jgi:hypothetical protein
MGGVVGFQDQGSVAHFPHPGCGQSGSLQEAPGALNAGKTGGYPIGNIEFWLKSILQLYFAPNPCLSSGQQKMLWSKMAT